MQRLTDHWVTRRFFPKPFMTILIIVFCLSIIIFDTRTSGAAEGSYASRPISIIVPWNPGSAVDLVPRIMAPHLSKKLGVSVNIVNKAGGSGVPGTLEAVKSAPDGHTVLSECPGTSSIQLAWMKDLPYQVERMYMALAVVLPTVIVVRADAPWKNLQDLEQAIRKDPASMKWGAVGTTQSDFGIYLLKAAYKQKGVDLSRTKTVSFQSGAPAMVALAGGHVDLYCGTQAMVKSYVDAGKARIIAVLRPERTKVFPGIATAVEQGYPQVKTDFWVGFSGPQNLSSQVVQAWENAVKEIVNDPTVLPEWDKMGGMAEFLPREKFRKFVMDEAKAIKAVSNP